MSLIEVEKRFGYTPKNEKQVAFCQELREAYKNVAYLLERAPDTLERSKAVTDLQQSLNWAFDAARRGDPCCGSSESCAA